MAETEMTEGVGGKKYVKIDHEDGFFFPDEEIEQEVPFSLFPFPFSLLSFPLIPLIFPAPLTTHLPPGRTPQNPDRKTQRASERDTLHQTRMVRDAVLLLPHLLLAAPVRMAEEPAGRRAGRNDRSSDGHPSVHRLCQPCLSPSHPGSLCLHDCLVLLCLYGHLQAALCWACGHCVCYSFSPFLLFSFLFSSFPVPLDCFLMLGLTLFSSPQIDPSGRSSYIHGRSNRKHRRICAPGSGAYPNGGIVPSLDGHHPPWLHYEHSFPCRHCGLHLCCCHYDRSKPS